MAQLKAKGVVFEEYDMPGLKTVNSIATGGGAKTAWFKDTEGNILAVSQRIRLESGVRVRSQKLEVRSQYHSFKF